jgi:hypothetical protein
VGLVKEVQSAKDILESVREQAMGIWSGWKIRNEEGKR